MSEPKKMMAKEKSLIRAYVLWLFGGIYGLHHFYLERDFQGFVWWTTLGGYGGWLADVVNMPRYVRDANGDPQHLFELGKKMRQHKKPPFSVNRFTGMLAVGFTWASVVQAAVPEDEVWGYNLKIFYWLVPLAAALGVWAVGNIGRERGSLKWPVLAAYATNFVRYYYYDKSVWLLLMALAAALAFDSFSKEWRRTPRKRLPLARRLVILAQCATIYLSLWASSLYFNETLVSSNGAKIPVFEVLQMIVYGQWWTDVKQVVSDVYLFAQHHGWYEVWKQLVQMSDTEDEQIAYEVLGVGPDASQQEITRRWRRLSRENHPDKARPEDRRAAQERFMDIQRAYELLSPGKRRRWARASGPADAPDDE